MPGGRSLEIPLFKFVYPFKSVNGIRWYFKTNLTRIHVRLMERSEHCAGVRFLQLFVDPVHTLKLYPFKAHSIGFHLYSL